MQQEELIGGGERDAPHGDTPLLPPLMHVNTGLTANGKVL